VKLADISGKKEKKNSVALVRERKKKESGKKERISKS